MNNLWTIKVINNSIEIDQFVSLVKDWFMLHKKFNQDLATYNFLRKKLIYVK